MGSLLWTAVDSPVCTRVGVMTGQVSWTMELLTLMEARARRRLDWAGLQHLLAYGKAGIEGRLYQGGLWHLPTRGRSEAGSRTGPVGGTWGTPLLGRSSCW